MAMSTAKYTFDAPSYEPPAGKKKHHRRKNSKDSEGGGEDGDPLDGSGSLTYSAASSINSAAGESTDSSFADIMRVLDVQDSKGLAQVLQNHGIRQTKDERSVAAESQHSLAYSTDAESHLRSLATDGESHLHGTGYLSTPGQPSDQYADDGGARAAAKDRENENGTVGATMDSDDLIFAPAEHSDSLKRRKAEKKKRERQDRTPRTKNTTRTQQKAPVTVESRQGTPPTARPPKAKETTYEQHDPEEEDVWLAKWWMFCFGVGEMTPKR